MKWCLCRLLLALAAAFLLFTGCGGPKDFDPTAQLLVDLREGDSATKIKAASEIAGAQGTLLTPEIVKELFSLLRNHEDPKVRLAAVRGLRGVGHGSVNDLIGIKNSEKDKEVQLELQNLINSGGGGPSTTDAAPTDATPGDDGQTADTNDQPAG